MKALFEEALRRLEAGENLAMVSVVSSNGSTPRGPGARMLVGPNGYVHGTVGGGAIEYEAIQLGQPMAMQGDCFTRTFVLRNEEAAQLGMVCGGAMELFFHRLTEADIPLCKQLLKALALPTGVYLLTDLATGRMQIAQGKQAAPQGVFVQMLTAGDFVHVFGGGHVAQALAPLLHKAGFRCVVMDDREAFVSSALFPDASQRRLVDYADLAGLSIGPEDSVAIMTRGHLGDMQVLSMALRTKARYIGMMGSAAKRAKVYESLLQQGFGRPDIDRVHSPIGMAIQAETPFEIAVSIAAELILVRALSRGEKQ